MWEDTESVLIGSFDVTIPNKPKLLMFDLDDTIITPKGKHRPGAPYTAWKFCKNVVKKLTEADANSLIVFISNQANLPKYKDNFKQKIEEVVSSLRASGVTRPILFYAASGYSNYRKPHTGIISDHLLPLLKDAGKIKEVIYVGDAAGRENDHSDSERKFLMNIALYFRSKKIASATPYFQEPEQYFEGKKASPFVLSGLNPSLLINTIKANKKLSEVDVSINYLKGVGQEVILMIGPPASGKTVLAKRIAKEWKYTRINQDSLGSKNSCLPNLTFASVIGFLGLSISL